MPLDDIAMRAKIPDCRAFDQREAYLEMPPEVNQWRDRERSRGGPGRQIENERITPIPPTARNSQRNSLGKAESQARYSLIVGIETPDNDIDLITPIEKRISELIQNGIVISDQ